MTFREYLNENMCGEEVTVDYKELLKSVAMKPGSKEWQTLLFELDGDERLAQSVIDAAAEEATNHFLHLLGRSGSGNASKIPPQEKSDAAWVLGTPEDKSVGIQDVETPDFAK